MYCNHDSEDQPRPTISNLISSLLRQLVYSAAYGSIKSFYNHHKNKGTYPTLREFLNALEEASRTLSKVFIVIDALDKFPDWVHLLDELQSLTTISLLVTSRDHPSVAEDFHITKHLAIHAKAHDVRLYVKSRIRRSHLRVLDVELRQKIEDVIVGNVDGMYVTHLQLWFSVSC